MNINNIVLIIIMIAPYAVAIDNDNRQKIAVSRKDGAQPTELQKLAQLFAPPEAIRETVEANKSHNL